MCVCERERERERERKTEILQNNIRIHHCESIFPFETDRLSCLCNRTSRFPQMLIFYRFYGTCNISDRTEPEIYFSHVHFITADLVTDTEGNTTVEITVKDNSTPVNVWMETGETVTIYFY